MNETEKTISLKDTFARKKELEAQANKLMEDLAAELERRIPEDLRQWANEKSFLRNDMIPAHFKWELPEWLECLMIGTKQVGEWWSPGSNSGKVRRDDLRSYGFRSFKDLITKFEELQRAWDELVWIEIVKTPENPESTRIEYVTVRFYAAELAPKPPEFVVTE